MPRSRRPIRTLDRLEQCIWYLNLEEMRSFCDRHGLPMFIHTEASDGRLRRTRDRDRKDIVIERIRRFALSGDVTGPTIYTEDVVASGPLPGRLSGRTRIRYGQYEKKNPRFLETMRRLTDGAFRTGMIARLVLRDFWTAGQAPTLSQFASAWLRATNEHTEPRPEGAYLADLSRGTVGDDWKEFRIREANAALRILSDSIDQRQKSE